MNEYEQNIEIMKDLRNRIDAVLSTQHSTNISTAATDIPDPTKHKYISFAKSAIRIVAGLALAGGGWLEMNPYIQTAGVLLVVAEVLGIAEEMV